MNILMNADPKVQKAVAIAALATGAIAIPAIVGKLGRKWAKERLDARVDAFHKTANNHK